MSTETTFSVLTQNIDNNHLENVELFQYALWDKPGEVQFFYDINKPGSILMSVFNSRISGVGKMVKSTQLSSYVSREVDLIKLDVEGSEFMVLMDLFQNDKFQFIHKMIIEYHHHTLIADDRLAKFLSILEESNFGYQIFTSPQSPIHEAGYQDIHIYAYRKS